MKNPGLELGLNTMLMPGTLLSALEVAGVELAASIRVGGVGNTPLLNGAGRGARAAR